MAGPEHRIDRQADLCNWLREHTGTIRVVGGGSRQVELPTPPTDATRLNLRGLRSIVRLDPGDQTCTVETGVPRAHLDSELAAHGLELPCLGTGTIGGLFASDPLGAASVPGQSPRSLLLGIEATLASGQPFRSGARVVKSVAGFDVHKLFVGSSGQLFVVRELHLRLKPKPRAIEWFANTDLDREPAIELLHRLRLEAVPPDALQLRRQRNGTCTVLGRVAGRSVYVRDLINRHQLRTTEPPSSLHVAADAGEEVIRGAALPSCVDRLLAVLPPQTEFAWLGGGRFEATSPDRPTTERLLQELPAPGTVAQAPCAAPGSPNATSPEAGASRLGHELKQRLDPDGKLV